eukprot:1490425-Pleurochrysis_carterae.AAC.3
MALGMWPRSNGPWFGGQLETPQALQTPNSPVATGAMRMRVVSVRVQLRESCMRARCVACAPCACVPCVVRVCTRARLDQSHVGLVDDRSQRRLRTAWNDAQRLRHEGTRLDQTARSAF